jgi:oligoribonuclease (3'-5' exoribonuclease)
MGNFYVPFDCETGGTNQETSDLLTLYMAVMDENFKIVEELDLKLKPDGGRLPIVEAQALEVNGINLTEHLADPETITYSEGKKKIVAMLKKYLKKKGRYSNLIPMGHNVGFDIDYIQQYLIPKEEWDAILHYRTVDTNPIIGFLKDCGWLPKELGRLESIVEYFGAPKRKAHTAKDDTLMMVDSYKALLELMASKKSGGGTSSQQDLIALLEAE